jgi:NADH:ubiquinone oxidoreductase subunit 4 (subunit M)
MITQSSKTQVVWSFRKYASYWKSVNEQRIISEWGAEYRLMVFMLTAVLVIYCAHLLIRTLAAPSTWNPERTALSRLYTYLIEMTTTTHTHTHTASTRKQ